MRAERERFQERFGALIFERKPRSPIVRRKRCGSTLRTDECSGLTGATFPIQCGKKFEVPRGVVPT